MKPSSSKNTKPVWAFFSSVRLAVFLLITLAVTSIAGTIIPQGQPLDFYKDQFSHTFFQIIRVLQLNDMYHAWWYLGLLGLFSLNLIVCTVKRLPFTLRLLRKDNLSLTSHRLRKMPFRHEWKTRGKVDASAIKPLLEAGKTRLPESQVDGGRLFLAEKGKWSHWGLYILHSSILVIFAGALTGSFAGFKGNIMLLEGESTDHIVDASRSKQIPLGFSIRCDKFSVSFYDTGAPREFKSDLAVLEGGNEVLKKSIVVNDPLEYKGISFYQSSYQAVPQVTVRFHRKDGTREDIVLSAFQRISWPAARLTLGLMQYLPSFNGVPAARIWLADSEGKTRALWLLKGNEKIYTQDDEQFSISLIGASQSYMTGLQVKKDPGVWIVWLGCTLLIFGFGIVFWVPHQTKWLWIGEKDGNTIVILAGQTNKNKIHFEKEFHKTEQAIESVLGVK